MTLNIADFRLTQPTSSYEVINRVIKLIRDEPKRLRMKTWGETLRDDFRYGEFTPACNTVACAAGWANFVIRGNVVETIGKEVADKLSGGGRNAHYEDEESNRRYRAYQRLYYGVFVADELTYMSGQGTPEHAEAVIDKLLDYRDEFEDLLKSVIIDPEDAVPAAADRQ